MFLGVNSHFINVGRKNTYFPILPTAGFSWPKSNVENDFCSLAVHCWEQQLKLSLASSNSPMQDSPAPHTSPPTEEQEGNCTAGSEIGFSAITGFSAAGF